MDKPFVSSQALRNTFRHERGPQQAREEPSGSLEGMLRDVEEATPSPGREEVVEPLDPSRRHQAHTGTANSKSSTVRTPVTVRTKKRRRCSFVFTRLFLFFFFMNIHSTSEQSMDREMHETGQDILK